MAEFAELTASRLASKIRNREISCVEYCEHLIARCESSSALNAVTDHDWDTLLQGARRVDEAPVGLLAGVPIAFKDNIDTKGLITSAGTGALRGFRPNRNAPVAQALFAEGALLGCKANMHELAFGITNNNAVTGATGNPYNPAMIPGGSSGGVAAAVAARLLPVGIGTDTGASVRLPAALCGCVGFRPTVGRYPGGGIVPISHTRDTPGPIVRCVEDAALIDAVLARDHPARQPARKSIRIGVPRRYFYDDLDPKVATVVEDALARIANEGIELVEADFLNIGPLVAAVSAPIARYEFLRDLRNYLDSHGLELDLTAILRGVGSPDVKTVVETELSNKATTRISYLRAIREGRPKLQKAYASYFAENRLDGAIFPTAPLPARPIGHDLTVELRGRQVSTFEIYIRNTDPASNAGIPAISVPAGLTTDGLPVGIEIDGPCGSDRRLLDIARRIEAAIDPLPKPPLWS